MIFGSGAGSPEYKANSGSSAQDVVFDADVENFEARVMMASMEKPVIVDFWAPWCGPCRQLGPALEKVVRENEGFVSMAKVNLDENQELAAALRIQSIPTVYAFFQGRPVDGFQGALPESQLRDFVGKIVSLAKASAPDAIDIPEALQKALTALNEGDIASAQLIYMQVLQQDEANVQAYTGLVRTYIAAGQMEQAQGLVDHAPEAIARNPAFSEARTALEMAGNKPAGPLDDLARTVNADPKNHAARIELAQGLFASGQKMAGVEALLESIKLDRDWNEQAARKELLKFFEAMGHGDPVTMEGRRKLSSILFS